MADGAFIAAGRRVPAGNGWAWIVDAWALIAPQRGAFIGIFVSYVLISVLLSLVPIVGELAIALFGPALTGGIMLACEALRCGETPDVGHLFAALPSHGGKLLATGAITVAALLAIVGVVALTVGVDVVAVLVGSREPTFDELLLMLPRLLIALLVILGLSVPVYMAIWFAAPLVVLGERNVGAALKASFGACVHNMSPFLLWSIAMLGLAIAATIPLALGWLLLGPVLLVSVYTSYRDIFYAKP